MSARTLRRAAERKERKLARKAEKANQSSTTESNTNMNNTNPPAPDPQTTTNEEAPSSPISAARLAANRENAKHSTGPTSPAGLAASSQNRTSHGLTRHANGTFELLLGEDPAAFAALCEALENEHQPSTETEIILVRTMAESQWLSERAARLQHTCLEPVFGAVENPKMFSLYMRYQTTHKRAFHKSLNDLQKLRSELQKAERGFVAQKIKTEQHKMKSDVHEMDLFIKSMAADIQVGKFTTLRCDALRQNPGFDAQFEAEKAKRTAAA